MYSSDESKEKRPGKEFWFSLNHSEKTYKLKGFKTMLLDGVQRVSNEDTQRDTIGAE